MGLGLMFKVLINPVFILIFLLLFTSNESHGKKKKVTIKVALIAPHPTPWSKSAKGFKKQVLKAAKKEKLKYKIKFKIYYGGILGGELETLRRLRNKNLDIWAGTMGAASSEIKELMALELPYIFKDTAHADYVYTKVIFDDLKALFKKRNYRLLYWSEGGWRHFATKKKPVRKPEDLKGLKIRTQEQMFQIKAMRRWGVNPVPLSAAETLIALQTGIVDGYDNTPLFSFATSWYTSAKYYSLTAHVYQAIAILMSIPRLEKMPPKVQQLLKSQDWKKLQTKTLKDIRRYDKPMLKNLSVKGLKIIELSEKEKNSFKVGVGKIYKEFNQYTSPEGRKILKKILDSRDKK